MKANIQDLWDNIYNSKIDIIVTPPLKWSRIFKEIMAKIFSKLTDSKQQIWKKTTNRKPSKINTNFLDISYSNY